MVFNKIEDFEITETESGIYFITKENMPPSRFASKIKFITYNSVLLYIYIDSKQVHAETLSLGDSFQGYSCSSLTEVFGPAKEIIKEHLKCLDACLDL